MHVQIILPTKNPREPTALFETLLCAASASIFLPHKFKMFSLFEIEFLFLQFSDTSVLCWVPLLFSVAWRLPPGGNHWAYLFPSLLSGITMLAPIIQCLKIIFADISSTFLAVKKWEDEKKIPVTPEQSEVEIQKYEF